MKLKLIIFPLCLIVINAFGFEGSIKQTVKNYNGSGTTVNMTWYLGPQNCRVDMSAAGKDVNSNSVLILDPATKTLKTYETNGAAGQKLYFQVDASGISGNMSLISVNVTQESKTIGGFKCTKWVVVTSAGVYNVWVTKDIDFDWSAYKEFFKTSVEVQALATQGVKGFAMLTEPVNGSNASSVESVAPHAVAANMFTVPAEYKLFTAAQTQPGKTK
jgi:hypothetical protein